MGRGQWFGVHYIWWHTDTFWLAKGKNKETDRQHARAFEWQPEAETARSGTIPGTVWVAGRSITITHHSQPDHQHSCIFGHTNRHALFVCIAMRIVGSLVRRVVSNHVFELFESQQFFFFSAIAANPSTLDSLSLDPFHLRAQNLATSL